MSLFVAIIALQRLRFTRFLPCENATTAALLVLPARQVGCNSADLLPSAVYRF
ncbi:MAG: hypothetical protein ABI690_07085 [Chloroflexota bacterium]